MSQNRKGSSTRDKEQMIERARERLRKRAKRGRRGYPVATVAGKAIGRAFCSNLAQLVAAAKSP
jgi:hypothetical protein